MMDLAIYLRLTPEFGGTRFGPFEKLETRLGSDEDLCNIVLPESLGVQPVHVLVLRQGNTNTIVAPADRAATVFVWRMDERRPTQITSPTALRSGDGFSLVTEDGPRFIMEIDVLPKEMQEERDRKRKRVTHGRGRLTKESMAAETKRQAWTTILTQAPAQMAQRAWTFIKSGAIYQPRNVFIGITMLGGWILGGWLLCSRGKQASIAESWQQKYSDCEVDRNVLQEFGETPFEELTFSQLAFGITNSSKLTSYLDMDSKMRNQVITEAKLIVEDEYLWLLEAKGQAYKNFKSWRDAVYSSESLDNDTRTLAVWLASRANMGRGEWQHIEQSGQCVRGPLQITSQMAAHQGLTYQEDDFFRGKDGEMDDEAELIDHMSGVFDDRGLEAPEGMVVDKARVDDGYCIYVQGEDDRTNTRTLIQAINSSMGDKAASVPPASNSAGSVARIARFWSSDKPWGDYVGGQGLKFKEGKNVFDQLDPLPEGAWVNRQTARVIAESILVPCLVRIHASDRIDKILGPEGEGVNHPPMLACVYLIVKLPQLNKGD